MLINFKVPSFTNKEVVYDQWFQITDGVIKFNCTCPEFQYRRLKEAAEKNIEPIKCKHLEKAFSLIDPDLIKEIK